MGKVNDIRTYKKQLRQQVKEARRALPAPIKAKKDQAIHRRLTGLYQYKQAQTLLCYVSTAIEVDTRRIIEQALADGKRVAVPRCIDGTHNMDFYLIGSFEDLEKRTFGVLEPRLPDCPLLTDFTDSICVVPALLYDLKGYRLGYGAGYYDRFLSVYSGFKVGIIYGECVRPHLQHGRYDVPVDLLVTENYIRLTKRDAKTPKRERGENRQPGLTSPQQEGSPTQGKGEETAAPKKRRRRKRRKKHTASAEPGTV